MLERLQVAFGRPTSTPCRWSPDSDQWQHSWRADSDGSGYGCSAHRRATRQGIVGITTAIGRRLTEAPAYVGRTESSVLLVKTETLDAKLLRQEEAEAKAEVEKPRPGLTVFTDGSRLDDGAAGYN